MSKYGVFSGPYFSDWIRRDTEYLSVFSPNAGKYGLEKTPYLDTFHAVSFLRKKNSEKKSVYNRELCICEIAGTLMIKNSKCIICIKCIISKLKASETYITNFAVLHEQKQPSRGVIIKVFWKYIANLQENTHAEVRFQ